MNIENSYLEDCKIYRVQGLFAGHAATGSKLLQAYALLRP